MFYSTCFSPFSFISIIFSIASHHNTSPFLRERLSFNPSLCLLLCTSLLSVCQRPCSSYAFCTKRRFSPGCYRCRPAVDLPSPPPWGWSTGFITTHELKASSLKDASYCLSITDIFMVQVTHSGQQLPYIPHESSSFPGRHPQSGITPFSGHQLSSSPS